MKAILFARRTCLCPMKRQGLHKYTSFYVTLSLKMCLFLCEFLFGQNRSTKFNNLAHWKCTKTAGPNFNSELDEKRGKRFPPAEHRTCFLNKGFKSNKLFIKNLLKDSNFRWWAGPVEQFYVPKLSNFNFISCNPTFHPCLWSVIVLQLDSLNCYLGLVANEKR